MIPPPTVDAVADELVRLGGWPRPPRRGCAGAPGAVAQVPADAGRVVGVDIGAVRVRCAVADLRGQVVAERVRQFGGADRLPVIRRELAAVIEEAGGELLLACVGCTGAMNRALGRVLFSSASRTISTLPGRSASRARS